MITLFGERRSVLLLLAVVLAVISYSNGVSHRRPFRSIKATRGSLNIYTRLAARLILDPLHAETIENYEVVQPVVTHKDNMQVSELIFVAAYRNH